MKRIHLRLGLSLWLAVSFSSTARANVPRNVTLHVALFPYIPDTVSDHFDALRKRLVSEFEHEHRMCR